MTLEDISESAAALDAMADEAATVYYDNAVKYGTGKYPRNGIRSSRSWSRFMQIARICLTKKVSVRKFVDSAFQHVIARHPLVTPVDICAFDPSGVDTPADSGGAAASPRDVWNLLSCKLVDIVFSSVDARSRTDVLNDAMFGFPAWFRVFFPEVMSVDIVLRWGELACDELDDNVQLDAFIKEKRPKSYARLRKIIGLARAK